MAINNVLGLDIGESKTGVARVNMIARLPQVVATLKNDNNFITEITKIIKEENIDAMVIGLPRNMNGEETAQTKYVRDYVDNYLKSLNLPIFFQDETLSSKAAEVRLAGSGYKKTDIDSMAAVVILEDYLEQA
jgi:putative Holliday junction resolvase